MPIVLALNSETGNLFIFFKNVGIVSRKETKLESPFEFFMKCRLLFIAAKLENF